MTVPHRVELIWPRTQAPCPFSKSSSVGETTLSWNRKQKMLISSKVSGDFWPRNIHRGLRMMGLKLCVKKSRLGWIFRGANRLWAYYVSLRSKSDCAALTSSYEGNDSDSKNAWNGKRNPKTHKNTPEVSQFYSFYWMKVKFSVFLSVKIVGILFPIQSLIMCSNSQRLPVTQYRLHSKVIVSLVINYHTLSSDAANLAVLFVLLNES